MPTQSWRYKGRYQNVLYALDSVFRLVKRFFRTWKTDQKTWGRLIKREREKKPPPLLSALFSVIQTKAASGASCSAAREASDSVGKGDFQTHRQSVAASSNGRTFDLWTRLSHLSSSRLLSYVLSDWLDSECTWVHVLLVFRVRVCEWFGILLP